MACKQLNGQNFFIFVPVCVTNNFIHVINVVLLAWGNVLRLAHLEDLLLCFFVKVLIKPIILYFLVRREVFLHENHWVHLVVEFGAFWTIEFFPECFTFKLETNKVRPFLILLECFKMMNLLFNFFFRPLFGGLLSFKFGFILDYFELVPSLFLWGFLFLQALFDQVHLVVILLVACVQCEHLLHEVSLVLGLLVDSLEVPQRRHNWNVRQVCADIVWHEVVHHPRIIVSFV